MKFLTFITRHVPITILTVLLVFVSWDGQIYNLALAFLSNSTQTILGSLGIITELKAGASSLGSSHIPLLGGAAGNLTTDLNKAFDYVSFAGLLVVIQTIILKLFSASVWLKFLPLVFLAGSFANRVRSFCVKMVLVLLLINPGLSLFVYGTSVVSAKMHFDLGGTLHEHLLQTRTDFQQKEQARKQAEDARNQQQLEQAEAKGKDHISLLHKVEDAVSDAGEAAALEVEKAAGISFDVLKASGAKLTSIVLNLLAVIIIVFLVLPFAYVYLLTLFVKRLFYKDIIIAPATKPTPEATPASMNETTEKQQP